MENFTLLSYTDLDGWDQVAEFRVSKDGRHAYVSNYQGFSIVDVSILKRVISKQEAPAFRASTLTSWEASSRKPRRSSRREDQNLGGGIRL
jgi:hypothetical protein